LAGNQYLYSRKDNPGGLYVVEPYTKSKLYNKIPGMAFHSGDFPANARNLLSDYGSKPNDSSWPVDLQKKQKKTTEFSFIRCDIIWPFTSRSPPCIFHRQIQLGWGGPFRRITSSSGLFSNRANYVQCRAIGNLNPNGRARFENGFAEWIRRGDCEIHSAYTLLHRGAFNPPPEKLRVD